MISHAEWWVSTAVTVALVTYGFVDCTGMAMPSQAMQCCKTMRCHAHYHQEHHNHEDCCKTNAQRQADQNQPAPIDAVRLSLVAVGVAQDFRDSLSVDPHVEKIAWQSHSPPLGSSLSPAIPLRV
jgi:hypothetical protein